MAVSRINEAGLNINQYGNRRMNINGSMQIAQRGTSAATANNSNEGYNTLDRWRILYSSSAGGAATMSQDTTVPNTSFANSLKLDVTTADTSVDVNHAITLQYRFEAQDIANSGWDYTNSDSNLSVSFWARSVKAGTYCVFFYTQDGTPKNLVQEYTLAANTWKHVTLTFKGDSGISFDDDNNNGLIVGWTLVAGANRYENVTAGTWITTSSGNAQGRYATSNQVNFFDSTSNVFYLTGVQVEVGDTATDFEHRSYGDELARCHRYFERFDYDNTQSPSIGAANSATTANAMLHYSEKRDDPTITLPASGQSGGALSFLTGTGGYPSATGTNSIQLASKTTARIHGASYSGLTSAAPTMLFSSGASSILIDAEL